MRQFIQRTPSELIALIVMVLSFLVIAAALAATKPRVLESNERGPVDQMFRGVYDVIGTSTAQNVYIGTGSEVYVKLPHNYGSTSSYSVVFTANTYSGLLSVMRVERHTGDSLKFTKTSADTGTVSIITMGTGVWGR